MDKINFPNPFFGQVPYKHKLRFDPKVKMVLFFDPEYNHVESAITDRKGIDGEVRDGENITVDIKGTDY
jgi:hypothetical protein